MKATAEAPCKAIITGEHFVVHGSWAMAAALGRRVRVTVSESDSLSFVSNGRTLSRGESGPLAAVTDGMAGQHSTGRRLAVAIESSVPEGSGLGSSASTMVALAAAVSRLHSLDLTADRLVEFAMLGERAIHGRPSGIDPNACARGGVILFKTGERPRPVVLRRPVSLLVVFSGRRRRTRALIDRVSASKASRPSLFESLARGASEITALAASKIRGGDMEGLGGLLTLNHAVLSTVGASTPLLDGLVESLLAMGCLGAKLTGAGGGGSVIALMARGKEKRTLSQLRARDFDAFETRLPVEGVKSWLGR